MKEQQYSTNVNDAGKLTVNIVNTIVTNTVNKTNNDNENDINL